MRLVQLLFNISYKYYDYLLNGILLVIVIVAIVLAEINGFEKWSLYLVSFTIVPSGIFFGILI